MLSNSLRRMHSLRVRLDICFMGAEHDWAEWIRLHELIRAVNDPWQILLVPAAPLVLIQPLPWLCVGENKTFCSSAVRHEMVLLANCWSTTFSAAWSVTLQMHPWETDSAVKTWHAETCRRLSRVWVCNWLHFLTVWNVRGLVIQAPVPKAVQSSVRW